MTVTNGDVIKLVVEAVLGDGTIVQNVYYLLAQLAAGQADQSVLNALETYVEAAYAEVISYLSDTVTFNPITADIIEWDGTKWETTYHIGTEDIDTAPAVVTEPLPNQIAPFATFNTERPKSKGRKFLFGFVEAASDGSFLISACTTAMAAFAAEVITTIVLGPLNELTPGIVRKGVDLFLEFSSAVVTNVVGTQRRRRPGVGI